MLELNLPTFAIKLKEEQGKTYVFDAIRKKHLVLTPEEWVRQHVVNYLINSKGVSAALIALEKSHTLNGRLKRSDIMVYGGNGNPLLIVECKAPSVKITQNTFEQIANYNMAFKVSYIMVTNGLSHYVCKIDWENKGYEFLEELPAYEDMTMD